MEELSPLWHGPKSYQQDLHYMQKQSVKLHPNVIFVGDRPNPAKNISLDVPFVGTSSYRILLEWIATMNLDINLVSTADAYMVDGSPNLGERLTEALKVRPRKVVALGSAASLRLTELNVPHFTLPNPLEATSQTNDKKRLLSLLIRCREYIYS